MAQPGDPAAPKALPAPEGPTDVIDTDYTVRQDNLVERQAVVSYDIHNPAFGFSAGVVPVFAVATLVFCLALIVSSYGRVRLGGPKATPDFSRVSWFAMLFAAGMGIGLMYYGVSEPMSHYDAALTGPVTENG